MKLTPSTISVKYQNPKKLLSRFTNIFPRN